MTVAVVDSSVLVAAVIDAGGAGRWAEERMASVHLAAPHLAPAEASNILRRAGLAGDVSEEEASLAHADLMEVDIELFPFEPFGSRVWELRANLTAYDAWYVALAEALECPVVTLDHRLARTPGIRCAIEVPPT